MDEVKLALELNKVVHNECKDVPHDIGLRLLEVVKKHIGEKLNLPPVINLVCDHERHYSEIDGFAYCNKCGAYMQ
jgi:hypothetical protein